MVTIQLPAAKCLAPSSEQCLTVASSIIKDVVIYGNSYLDTKFLKEKLYTLY